MENIAAGAASVSGVVEDAEAGESKAHGGAKSLTLLAADSVVRVPHTSTISVTSGVVEVTVRAGTDTRESNPDAGAIGVASGSCGVARAVSFAVVSGRVPHAAAIGIASRSLDVTSTASTSTPLISDVPFAEGIDGTRVEISLESAVRRASVAISIPETFGVSIATRSLVVGELALLAADGSVPSAHLLLEAAFLNHERISDSEFDSVDS